MYHYKSVTSILIGFDSTLPISVLVYQSKVFEGIMVDKLMQFMNGKVSDLLSTYRKDYSTQNVLLHAIEE